MREHTPMPAVPSPPPTGLPPLDDVLQETGLELPPLPSEPPALPELPPLPVEVVPPPFEPPDLGQGVSAPPLPGADSVLP